MSRTSVRPASHAASMYDTTTDAMSRGAKACRSSSASMGTRIGSSVTSAWAGGRATEDANDGDEALVHDHFVVLFELEVGDVEGAQRLNRLADGFVGIAAAPRGSKVVSHLAQRAQAPRPIEALTLTVFAECHEPTLMGRTRLCQRRASSPASKHMTRARPPILGGLCLAQLWCSPSSTRCPRLPGRVRQLRHPMRLRYEKSFGAT